MMLKSWLRRVGINSLKRFVRNRRKIDGQRVDLSPATSAAPVCVAFPVAFQQLPDPVAQTFIGGVGPVDTVRSFLFGGQPGTSVNPSSTYQVVEGEPSPNYGGFRPPDGLPPDQLRARLWRVLASSDLALLPGPGSTVGWPGELMAFQLDGVKILIESQRLLLADDMGLGKTVQVITALRVLFLKGEISTALVIAPASILDQWRRELLKWAPDLRAMVIRGHNLTGAGNGPPRCTCHCELRNTPG